MKLPRERLDMTGMLRKNLWHCKPECTSGLILKDGTKFKINRALSYTRLLEDLGVKLTTPYSLSTILVKRKLFIDER